MYIFQKGRIQPRDTLFAINMCGVSLVHTSFGYSAMRCSGQDIVSHRLEKGIHISGLTFSVMDRNHHECASDRRLYVHSFRGQ